MKNTFPICEQQDQTSEPKKSSYTEADLKKIKKYYEMLVKMQLQVTREERQNKNAQEKGKTNELEK